jgi:hypothetical protein
MDFLKDLWPNILSSLISTVIVTFLISIFKYYNNRHSNNIFLDKIVKKPKLTIAISFVLVLVILFGIKIIVPTPIEISIRQPASFDEVQPTETISGTAQHIPKGEKLWIAIYPQKEKLYYPQIGSVYIQENGNWTHSARFGGANDVGKKFDIVPFLADENAQKELNKSLTTSGAMTRLPDGTTEYSKVTVIRADDRS